IGHNCLGWKRFKHVIIAVAKLFYEIPYERSLTLDLWRLSYCYNSQSRFYQNNLNSEVSTFRKIDYKSHLPLEPLHGL
ncbi:MAG: hypothetical protein P8N53_00365, partial [Paracoccaceae bacterium]|nr:hypothetical protein [Paracoccaceae bacterium]